MKKILLIFPLMFFLVSCSEREIEFGKLVKRQEIYFVSFEEQPYSGKVITTHDGHAAAINGYIDNGKIDGLWRDWHENGQLSSESTYVNGKSEGLTRTWYKNGQLESESNFEADKQNGITRWWNEDGELEADENWINGQKNGLQVYYCSSPNPFICGLSRFGTTKGLVEEKDGVYKEVYCFRNNDVVDINICSE